MRSDVDLIVQPYVPNRAWCSVLEGDRYKVIPIINQMVRRKECLRPNYMLLNEKTGRVEVPLVMLKRPRWISRKRRI